MLIKIKQDVFFVVNRLKEIDKFYFVVFNTQTQKYEVHNSSQKNSYCLTVPYDSLDKRTIDLVLKTRKENYDNIMAEIDRHNDKINKDNETKMNDLISFKLREMFDYAKKHDIEQFNDAYKTRWA